MPDDRAVSRLHHHLIRGLIDRQACPTNSELATQMGIEPDRVEELLRDLAAIHGVVLHPHVCEPWIVHPFSVAPAPQWIEGAAGGWWSPCMWCGLGVAVLTGGEVRIHTRIAGEADPLIIPVTDGEPAVNDLWVHFAIPPARAWDNVHQHCSMVLAFHSPDEVLDWCHRHRLPHGEAVPLRQVARLARLWYGSHADPDWHKWTMAEAQHIFREAGLDSPFWDLAQKSGRF